MDTSNLHDYGKKKNTNYDYRPKNPINSINIRNIEQSVGPASGKSGVRIPVATEPSRKRGNDSSIAERQ